MTVINIFTENVFDKWKVDEKDIIEKTRKMLNFYISNVGNQSCLNEEKFSSGIMSVI